MLSKYRLNKLQTDFYLPFRTRWARYPDLFTEQNERQHMMRRRIVNHAYSMSNIIQMEEGVDNCIDMFMRKFTECAAKSTTMDLADWSQWCDYIQCHFQMSRTDLIIKVRIRYRRRTFLQSHVWFSEGRTRFWRTYPGPSHADSFQRSRLSSAAILTTDVFSKRIHGTSRFHCIEGYEAYRERDR